MIKGIREKLTNAESTNAELQRKLTDINSQHEVLQGHLNAELPDIKKQEHEPQRRPEEEKLLIERSVEDAYSKLETAAQERQRDEEYLHLALRGAEDKLSGPYR